MSTGMPELGSKISLISKADIRYEGRLFTVDPQECTIALSNVRSFGTEDRDTPYQVAPQNQIYDYILFRGSDIKDIRVVNNVNPIPNDPAIVTLSVPPPLASAAYQPQPFSHGPMLGHMGAQFPAYSGMGGVPSGLAPGMGMPRGSVDAKGLSSELPELPGESGHSQDLIGGGRSGSATPVGGIVRKSPTMDQGTQAGGQGGQQSNQGNQSNQGPVGGHQRGDDHQPQQQQNRNNRAQGNRPPGGMGWSGPWGQPQHQQHQQGAGGWGQQQQQQQQQNRGGWRGGPRRGRGRGNNFMRPPQGPPQGQSQQQGQQGSNNVPGQQKKNVLKFEGDYDFEQANTQFETLRSQLAKMKIGGVTVTAACPNVPISAVGDAVAAVAAAAAAANNATSPSTVGTGAKVNGEEKKDADSGNETGVGEGEAEEDDAIFYDKAKSFFDNISCEAIERSKGCSQRTDWRQERKLNSETFGVASARRGYRGGRGGYYRGGGMYGRGGGYRGGYRGRGGYNNRNHQQHQGQQHQGQQQQQQQQGGGGPNNAARAAAK